MIKGVYFTFSVLLLFGFIEHAPKSIKPNIIVVLIDDAGYADFGFMGSKDLLTPNLDKLASKSLVFTDAHVSASVCSPSRAGLITGKYQQRFGYECNEGDGYSGIDVREKLMPAYLKEVGYQTIAFGKWHLGYKPEQHPLKMGFDEYHGFLSGGRSYFYNSAKDDKPGSRNALLHNYSPVAFDGYLTDHLGKSAAAYIQKNSGAPFFMYWAPNAVHTPMEADSTDLAKFNGHPRQKLAAMTFALDRAVGTMVQALEKQGILDNTIIIFLSDNGGAHNNQSTNGALKGFKGNEYEAGHRIPFFIHWPAAIKKPGKYHGLTSALDILPTVVKAAGYGSLKAAGLDGVDLHPYITGVKQSSPHETLIWRKDAMAAIRAGDHKLIRVKGLGTRLYNLRNDLHESKDLRQSQPQVQDKLLKQLLNWEKHVKQPLWTEGAIWDTITLMIHDDLMQNKPVRVADPEALNRFRAQKQVGSKN